jgi:hypothetical protein
MFATARIEKNLKSAEACRRWSQNETASSRFRPELTRFYFPAGESLRSRTAIATNSGQKS